MALRYKRVRSFEKSVCKDLETISESLRLTASSFGLQPWKFLIISNEEVKKSLLEHIWNQKQVVDCSHHIVFCCPRKFDDTNVDAFLADTAKTRNQSLKDLEGYGQIMKGFLSNIDEEKKQK